jgi:hypothetical protein
LAITPSLRTVGFRASWEELDVVVGWGMKFDWKESENELAREHSAMADSFTIPPTAFGNPAISFCQT